MTNAELKDALFNAVPVTCDGIEYLKVCQIVYSCPAKKLVISAGLLDKNENCIVYVNPEKVMAVSDGVQEN